ncbi:prostaglandin E synthase 2 [Lutzomyia longipalpis]|uniref:Putative glutathione s-transferase-related protein n=1 Tax=Lutzomyia longipalpis TaxID=7200 RepID=A0A1B0EV74_LUTLO|nr:prostaglandin E synthase 2 [Lutzomyia longipalpis]
MASNRFTVLGRNLIRYSSQGVLPRPIFGNFSRFSSTSAKKSPGTLKLTLKGLGLGLVLGTGYAGYTFVTESKPKAHLVNEKEELFFLDTFPNVKITRKIVNPADKSGLKITLFQYQTCPFCCKVRAFMDHSGLSYDIVEVDAVLRQDIKWSPTKKVPTMLIKTPDGKYLQLTDSSMIISALASFLRDKEQNITELASFYPSISYHDEKGKKKSDIMNKYFLMFKDGTPRSISKEELEEERKWRTWADNHLVHLISPNVYRTKEEALETFEWFSDVGEWSEHFPAWERNLMVYVGAAAMWAISKRLKKRHELSDDVRGHIYDALDRWVGAVEKKKTPFLGGKKPNLADLAVFGVLSSMEGCRAFTDCLDNTQIAGWFYAVKEQIMRNRGTVA